MSEPTGHAEKPSSACEPAALTKKPSGDPEPAALTKEPSSAREPAALAAGHLWGFLTALRAAGVTTALPKQADLLRVVGASPPRDLTTLYWYARITLLHDIGELAAFDRVFTAWFRRGGLPDAVPPPPSGESDAPSPQGPGEDDPAPREVLPGDGVEASTLSTYGRRDFDAAGDRWRSVTRALEAAWPAVLPSAPSRRRRPARSGDRLDVRHIWRRAHRHDGEIVELRRRARPPRPRRLLILVDVSGSLRRHTPDLLRLAHTALRAAPARTEVFTFGTRLTRITSALSHPHTGRALRAVSELVTDADGGTAIGAALHEFLGVPRFVALARGALVIVISDGLERGDCVPMVRATARLSRLGHRLVWWSPLACSPTYRPVTRAMAAQLPHLDHLGGVRDLATGLAEVRRLPAVLSGPRRAAARRPHTPRPTRARS
ncbi:MULTISPECIES: vWA domain-containing protein [unclassified Streptosporangium]|uniref:vWA domain-containing protein n=1 Tax=unclassified Streptosporangium TaxID=2632669 RepID=UPI002E2AF298|nr:MULTISPECIES: VWA domain-containing protein [unclassified Streptosporangium]